MQTNPTGYDARKFGRAGIDAVKTVAKQKIIAFGSNNQAN
jgi:fructose/tagatose bisphosphate aldolase